MNVRRVIPRDAIPSVDDPEFAHSYEGDPEDTVVVVEADPPRAYPIRYLHYHEIVNDVVSGLDEDNQTPIAVTWCPLCGSAVVYERRIESQTLTFGVSGKLADDDLVMYDRETESEWKQSRGEAITGELRGTSLQVRPIVMMAYEAFTDQYSNGIVLQQPGGKSEAASEDDDPAPVDYNASPYERYFEMDGFGLAAHRSGESTRSWDRDDIDPKTVVLGIELGDDAVGVPLPTVESAGGALTIPIGGTSIVVFATEDGLHVFQNPGFEFENVGTSRFRADGTVWNCTTGISDDGRSLERIPARRLFAFGWQDDHGPDSFLDRDR